MTEVKGFAASGTSRKSLSGGLERDGCCRAFARQMRQVRFAHKHFLLPALLTATALPARGRTAESADLTMESAMQRRWKNGRSVSSRNSRSAGRTGNAFAAISRRWQNGCSEQSQHTYCW